MIYTRLARWFSVLALLLAGLKPALADPALQLDSAKAKAGQEALLTLSLNSEVQQVCGLLVTLRFDAAQPGSAPLLSLTNPGESRLGPAFEGSLYGTSSVFDPNTNIALNGQRRIGIVHSEPVDGPAKVISLPFQISASTSGGTVYTVIATVQANDFQGIKFPVESATGTITVEGPTQKLGDVNGNGKVEVSDVIQILRVSLGLQTLSSDQMVRADCNSDGRINVGDAVAALRIAVGLA
jgi:hypothetical protein